MQEISSGFSFQLVLSIVILGAMVIRLAFQYLSHKRSARDAQSLSLGLRVELAALRRRYDENIDALTFGGLHLFSTRSGNAFYRGNIGRIVSLLDTETLEAVVSAFTYNEMLDVEVSAESLRQKGAYCYRIEPGKPNLQKLKEKYKNGCRQIDTAIDNLNRGATKRAWRARDARNLIAYPVSRAVQVAKSLS